MSEWAFQCLPLLRTKASAEIPAIEIASKYRAGKSFFAFCFTSRGDVSVIPLLMVFP